MLPTISCLIMELYFIIMYLSNYIIYFIVKTIFCRGKSKLVLRRNEEAGKVEVIKMPLGPLGTNCYIVHNNKNALIFDPGGDEDKIIHYLEDKNIIPQAILLTHAHFDHIGGVETLRKHYNIEVYLHEKESSWLAEPSLNGSSLFMGDKIVTQDPDKRIVPGKMTIGEFNFDVLYTPGHSPGSTSFVFEDEGFVISGDVLFKQGIGRTDLPGGDYKQLESSIRYQLYKLSDTYLVYPGHGGTTTIREEKNQNPFVRE